MTQPDIERLRELLAKATPGDLSTAQRHTECKTVECPMCGEGEVEAADYCNFDGVALGVQFYGIGKHFGAHEELWCAVSAELPGLLDTIEALIKERDALKEALTPSGGTKAAYIGEVKERICVFDEDGEESWAEHAISWDATKATMKMIADRAVQALSIGGEG